MTSTDNRRQSGLWQQNAHRYYEQVPPGGPYKYYEPPRRSASDGKRSFSDRQGGPGYSQPYSSTSDSGARHATDSQRIRERTRAASEKVTGGYGDDIPNNVRAQQWSPNPIANTGYPSNSIGPVRRSSVAERSPLQKLELSAKEQKRVRAEEAERRASQRSSVHGQGDAPRHGTLRSEKHRIVSDESRQHDRDTSHYTDRPGDPVPVDRFRGASEGLRSGSSSHARQHVYPAMQQPGDTLKGTHGQYPHADPISGQQAAQHDPAVDIHRYSTQDPESARAGAYDPSAADRGKAAYERRKQQQDRSIAESEAVPGRTERRRLQPGSADGGARRSGADNPYFDRATTERESKRVQDDQEPYSAPGTVTTGANKPISYRAPPRTAAGQGAQEWVLGGSADTTPGQEQHGVGSHEPEPESRFHFRSLREYNGELEPRGYLRDPKPLEDWRRAKVGRLTAADLDIDVEGTEDQGTWWERQHGHRSSGSGRETLPQVDGAREEEAKRFRPMLFLKCGPLLRYTGLRKDDGGKEIWRGSIMVVTDDSQSDYTSAPSLRLFAQPADLHQPPSRELLESGKEIPPEFEDPVAGQLKISRTGRPLYVRPVHEINGETDLSREENNQGLYAATRTSVLGPQFELGPDGRQTSRIKFQDKSRIRGKDGERQGRYRDVPAARLHTERGLTFWRWTIEIELGSQQHRIAYRVNRGPALGFWVPASGETMNIMFHSCNGFSLSVNPDVFSGPDPLWRDVLNRHQSRPFHVMLGGGDQIYNDAATKDTELFKEWLGTKSSDHKYEADFSQEMQDELETFYLNRYAMWFSQGLFAMANSQIPMVNLWDDHDIIDGYGSYPDHFMSTPVFTGVGAVAFKYYMLFQHQSLPAETSKEEPSWVLGASPGPYLNELSRNVFLQLGHKVAFLGLDCRTERRRDEILSQESYDLIFDRCRKEIVKGDTNHLLVLLGVPIAYPRLNFLENILTSRMMDPIKAIGRKGMLGGFVNKFDGGVEILDDLDDHWTAKHHKAERNWFIQELQELAAEKSVRITILGGDVHLGAVGQFYTPRNFGVRKDRDHRYIPNVISSAIVNTPPPPMMADGLNKRNKIHHLDDETDEDMIPMFETDVDGTKRNNKYLLPRRNYCTIREYVPGRTPPPTPPPQRQSRASLDQQNDGAFPGYEDRDRRFPPGSISRTMSLTRAPAQMMRRFSMSGRSRNPPISQPFQKAGSGMERSNSLSGPRPDSVDGASAQRPNFLRRPTTMNEKEMRRAVAKGGAPDEGEGDAGMMAGAIDLEGGLDVALHMEIDQKDPGGTTVPYRLLVPQLFYDGAPDINTARFKSRGATFMDRFRGRQEDREHYQGEDDNESRSEGRYSSQSPSRSPSPARPTGKSPPLHIKPPDPKPIGGPTWRHSKTTAPSAPRQSSAMPTGHTSFYDGPHDQQTSTHRSTDLSRGAGAGAATAAPARSGSVQAYHRGFSGSGGPPLGGQYATSRTVPGAAGAAPGGGGARCLSGPAAAQKHTQQDECSDSVGWGSEEPSYGEEMQPAERRLGKAERFFGMARGNGRSAKFDGPYGVQEGFGEQEKKRPKWKIWK